MDIAFLWKLFLLINLYNYFELYFSNESAASIKYKVEFNKILETNSIEALPLIIEELKKKIPSGQQQQQQQQQFEIPQEIKDQLEELKQYKNERSKQEKYENILTLAKKDIRDDLHSSFEKYAKDYDVKLDKEDKEQADALVARFKDIFKDTLGDIRPQKPVTTQKQVEDVIGSVPKIKVSN